jgi:two-component system response regulator RegA
VTDAKLLLVVDDDDIFRERLARSLRERDYVVKTAADGEHAVALARAESPEAAILDLKMPGISGIDVIGALHEIDETTRIVVLTGYGSVSTVVDSMKRGAADYLQKPVDLATLLRIIEGAEPCARENAGVPDVSLARAEWEHIQRVLRDCGGNISEASRRLRIHRRSLQRKLQKYPPP